MNKLLSDLYDKNCFTFGSYVYKYKLRGEKNNDIDIGVPFGEMADVVKFLEKYHGCTTSFNNNNGRAKMTCYDTNLDLIDDISEKLWLYGSQCDTFKITHDRNGYGYVNKNKDIEYENENMQKIITDIKNSKIQSACLKGKYKTYFQNWTKTDGGFFNCFLNWKRSAYTKTYSLSRHRDHSK